MLHAPQFLGGGLPLDEGVVVAELGPGAARDAPEVHKTPVYLFSAFYAQIVADSRRDIQAGTLVLGVLGLGGTEDVGPVLRGEGAAVFPLGKAVFPLVEDLEPLALADGHSRLDHILAEPGDDPGGLRLVLRAADAVVVGQGDVEGVLPGDEVARAEFLIAEVLRPVGGLRVVESAVVLLPLCIPGALVIGDGIVGGRCFAYPEDGDSDVFSPRIDAGRGGIGVQGARLRIFHRTLGCCPGSDVSLRGRDDPRQGGLLGCFTGGGGSALRASCQDRAKTQQ